MENPLYPKININDLDGLTEFHDLIEFLYRDPIAVETVYKQKLFSFTRRLNAGAAQRALEFEISLATYYVSQIIHTLTPSEKIIDEVLNKSDRLTSNEYFNLIHE